MQPLLEAGWPPEREVQAVDSAIHWAESSASVARTSPSPFTARADDSADVTIFAARADDADAAARAAGSTTSTANGISLDATVSADGRFVAFVSDATDLIPGQIDSPLTKTGPVSQLGIRAARRSVAAAASEVPTATPH